jgi:sugar (pentulose or hexulose) kinase
MPSAGGRCPVTDTLVGIDVGTTWCKAAVVSMAGRELAHDRVRVPWRTVPSGAEIDVERLFEVAVRAGSGAIRRAAPARVVALGVTGMAETGALLDAKGEVVTHGIAWYDGRGADAAESLRSDLGEERFSAVTGLPASRLCTLAKYRWLRTHEPAAARGARWLSVGEWVVRRLGGEEVADLSLASRTGMLHLDRREPWTEALAWAGAPSTLLPAAAPSGTAAGRIREALPEALGAVLTVAGHDHLCAAIGAGAVADDDVFDSCGTAEAFVRAVPPASSRELRLSAIASGITVGWHAIPDHHALLGGFEAGLALQRLGRAIGASDQGRRRELDREAMAAEPGGDAAAWRAAHEALAARGSEVLTALERLAGPTGRLVVAGGGARSGLARALKSSALGAFELPAVDEAGARGAALLAGCAAGVYGGVQDLPPAHMTPMEALS